MTTLNIRTASIHDVHAISKLIYLTSLTCCFTPEQPCPDWFKASVAPTYLEHHFQSAQMVWLVAEQAHALLAVLAVSDKCQIKYFFVHPNHQNLGIGKQLWQYALRNGVLGDVLTVRSSLFAVPVYQRLGFKIVEPPSVFNGMHYQMMQLGNHTNS